MVDVEVYGKMLSTLPEDDDHPYRSGPWRPQSIEYDAADLDVQGELPDDLYGVYLRNTENPLHPAIVRYHPFDGDGMIHKVSFRDGKVSYRNRFVRTDGLLAEQEAGRSLWAGIAENPNVSDPAGRLGRPRPDEGRRVDRRGRARRGRGGQLLAVRRPVPAGPAHPGRPGQVHLGRVVPARGGRLRAHQGRRPHRRAAVLQLRHHRALPALRRGRRGQPAGALRADRPARAAAAARHGLHRALRDPQRHAAVLGARTARAGPVRLPVPPGHPVPAWRHPAPRRLRRHPLVRVRPDLRAALDQRLRRRRRDRRRRVLPGLPGARRRRAERPEGEDVPVPGRRTSCRPGCTGGG